MTYYEELGVGAQASADEIRKAYKRLARLLHPDKIQEKAARHVAECQMRRINGIRDTLTDSERRRHYDQSLAAPPAPAPPQRMIEESQRARAPGSRIVVISILRPNLVWVGAVVLAACILIYTFIDTGRTDAGRVDAGRMNTASTPVIPPDYTAGAESSQIAATLPLVNLPQHRRPQEGDDVDFTKLQRRLGDLATERTAAQTRIADLESRMAQLAARHEPLPVPIVVEPRSIKESPPPVGPALPVDPVPGNRAPTPSALAAASPRGLNGSWFFAKSPASRNSRETYAAEYIETVITVDDGFVSGRYRARYLVMDRTISPEVAFQFSGKASAETGPFPWLGTGGARGDIRLRLIGENTLEVVWVASQLGTLGLASGKAVLTRRQDYR